MNVLGIETSCDETAAALVTDGRTVISNAVFSQASEHAPFGGVVPELASRRHLEVLPLVVQQAINDAQAKWEDVDAIAVTYGPGLASALLVGIAAAKGLALRLDRPLKAVNHIEAHVYSIFLGADAPHISDVAPFVCLVVSGGHTCLLLVEHIGKYRLLGQTLDDAAGEAFDKGANLLGLGYPGGPAIQKAAAGCDPSSVNIPRSRPRKEICRFADLNPSFCFSFSGLKTALLYHLRDNPLPPPEDPNRKEKVRSLAAAYQEAIVESLLWPCAEALKRFKRPLGLAGGVSLNTRLREKLADLAAHFAVPFFAAEPQYCADNAAMVAGLAATGHGLEGQAAFEVDAAPDLPIGEPLLL